MRNDGPAQGAGHFQFRSGYSYRIRTNRRGYIAVLPSSRIFTGIAALSLAATAACTTDPQTGQKRMSKAGIGALRSEEHTSELQSLMRTSYSVFCLKKKKLQKLLTQC